MKKIFFASLLSVIGWLPFPASAQLSVGTLPVADLNEPYNIAEDDFFNIYISDSGNNRILKIDGYTQAIAVFTGGNGAGANGAGYVDGQAYATAFNNPQGMIVATIGGTNGLIVADTDNGVIRFVRLSDGYVSTLAGNTNGPLFNSAIGVNATFRYPYSLTQDTNGNVYIADWGNNAIRVLNLNDPNFGVASLTVTDPAFSLNRPTAVAFAGMNQLWVADTGNNMIKLITLSNPTTGSQTTYMGGRTPDYTDNPLGSNARFNGPRALLWDPNLGLLISDTGNNTIRLATNNPVFGATNYAVTTFAGTGAAGLANGGALSSSFNSPFGMVKDIPNSRYLLADGLNNAIRIIQYGPVLGPCPPPTIGYITFEFDVNMGQDVSVLHSDPPFVFNNDIPIGISFPQGYSAGFTLDGSSPTKSSPAPNRYHQILSTLQLPGITISLNYNSNVTVTAFTYNTGQPSSPATNALFHFVTGTPQIQGQNAAEFYVGCVTTNATLYYTTDGSDPRAGGNNVYIAAPFNPATTLAEFKFTSNNFPFQCFARRIDATHNYADSTAASNYFSADNYKPNAITFGLTNGEPHSGFIARPGQFFYAPVTLQLTPGFGKMFSLQFNVTVTNGFTNIFKGTAIPPIVNGAGLDFFSMLMSQVPEPEGLSFPPADGNWYLTIPPVTAQSDLSAPNYTYPRTVFVDTNNNLLGVGWLFRPGYSYLTVDPSTGNFSLDFPTAKQDLITYSIAHDTLFTKAGGTIMVGAYSFQVPNTAVNGDQYFIQLGSPSGTADGVGAPGAGIYIQPPALSQAVTVGSPAYLVGDAAPFHWLNAGDFGDTNLDNSDVMQVYQAAILGVDMPPHNSDLYLAMDSCGNFGISNAAAGYFTNGGPYLALFPVTNTMTLNNLYITNDIILGSLGSTAVSSFTITNITITESTNLIVFTTNIVYTISSNSVPIPSSIVTNVVANNVTFNNTNFSNLFDGSDQTINQIAFGDGNLDINDLYVTFRRSLDPSLVWFKRYWTNGMFVAVPTVNYAFNSNTPHLFMKAANSGVSPKAASVSASYLNSSVTFTAGDAIASGGNIVQIPITANIFGSYPLRVLGLNLAVHALDGSPDLTQQVTFTPNAALGTPTISSSKGLANYSAAWLNSEIAGLSGSVTLGTLTVTLPANVTGSSAYAVHFDYASGSPNGLAIFPNRKFTGLITTASRTSSSYGDGIPDSWRLRWFGTVNNLLSVSNACPTSDGVNNWNKYVAGVDPNSANDFPSVNPRIPAPSGSVTAIHWPTVAGKQYVIERSTSLFSGNWTRIATNTGTGTDMEFDDNAPGSVKFYRVLILP